MEETNKEIFINVSSCITRIVITDDGTLSEFYIERPDNQRQVGNIYKGTVQNVLPGMQAAFINIGTELNAFLPFTEIENPENFSNFSLDDDDAKKSKKITKKFDPANDLKIGDDISVQIIKEAYGNKGPRITTAISLPGSLLVLVPNADFIGISRKINDKYEKRRLKRIVDEFKPKNFGLILRTIAYGKDQNILESDYNRLWSSWLEMENKMSQKAPGLLYEDYHTVDQVIRDLFTPEINKITVDSKEVYNRLIKYLKEISPSQVNKVSYHRKKGSIFDRYQIENQIEKILSRKVWLKSGAYLIIEHTEAMVVIDVNSGRYIGKKDHEQNSLKINLEASLEIARQLCLRDIGGLIVIDYIDLQEAVNRKKVYKELLNALMKDRAKVSLSEFSNFGLLEMTRQRIGLSLLHTVKEECNICNGSGWINTKETLLTQIENWFKRFKVKNKDRRLILKLNPHLVNYIKTNRPKLINGFMWNNKILIELQEDINININNFNVYSKKRKEDVTNVV